MNPVESPAAGGRAGQNGALGGYRVLDLAEDGSGFCAKLLANWGAEVIKVEPPSGSRLRSIGPFYHDLPHRERSLFWFAFNTDKRSVTLNLGSEQGRQVLRRLVGSADFLVESFAPGYLDGLGLGYSSLSQLNPGLVMASITPFGQTGPYSGFRSCELVNESMGGIVYNLGTPDRPPIRPMTSRAGSVACQLAEIQAACGCLMASYYRLGSGEGQHVDVSIQEGIANVLQQPPIYWDTNRILIKRVGGGIPRTSRGVTTFRCGVFPAKDGYVQALLHYEWFEDLVDWLVSEGLGHDLKRDMEKWRKRISMTADPPLCQEEVTHIEEAAAALFAKHTKAEIYQQAEARDIGFGPISSPGEVMDSPQLKARSYFTQLDHPELGEKLTYGRPPFLATVTQPSVSRRAPLIGEHNEPVYIGEMGFSREELVFLKQSGAI